MATPVRARLALPSRHRGGAVRPSQLDGRVAVPGRRLVGRIVGALLATGVVLVGGHLTHLLPSSPPPSPNAAVTEHYGTNHLSPAIGVPISTTTTVLLGVEPGLYQLASRVTSSMPVVLDGNESGVGVVVSPKGYVLVPASLVTDWTTSR